MKQLELKYLAPYLPYKLKIVFRGNNPLQHWSVMSPNHLIDFINESFKPILRPLSDLTKEIEHNGKKFVPIIELLRFAHPDWFMKHESDRYGEVGIEQTPSKAKAYCKYQATIDLILYTGFTWNFPYWISEKLFEWHFNVFDLPENLWIDVNSLG